MTMKKTFSLSNLLIAVAIAFLLYQAYIANLDGTKPVRQGERRLFQHDYPGALQSFSAALEEIRRADTAFFFSKGMTIDKAQNRIKARHGLGSTYAAMKNWTQANEYLTQVLETNPYYTKSKSKRASVLYRLGDYDGAVTDCTDILLAAPNALFTIYKRGNAHLKLEDYQRAVTDYTRAAQLAVNGVDRPERLYIQNTLARLLATCPQKAFRDGTRAMALAEEVVSTAKATFASPRGLRALLWFEDTLAAAYAEAGHFGTAEATLQKTLSQVKSPGNEEEIKTLQQHLLAFKNSKPLREKMEPIFFP